MNLRIEGNHLRFRIAKEELQALCANDTLSSLTPLPGDSSMEVNIALGDQENSVLTLLHQGHDLMLHVGEKAANDLLAALPSREGIETTQLLPDGKTLHLMLEVDIRSQKRNRA